MSFAMICLSIWDIPNELRFFCFYLGGFSGMASPILYSFVNTRLSDSYGERGLVISSMMTIGFAMQIWIPLFTFPTIQAPKFPHGYPAALVFEVAMWGIFMAGVWYMARWKLRQNRSDEERVLGVGSGTGSLVEDEKKGLEGSEISSGIVTPEESVVPELTESRVSNNIRK